MWSFCTVLGPEEANKQLRRHWQTWVTEDDLRKLHAMKINALRIPVGDWMWRPYGAYVNCTAGALHELDRVLDLAHAYGMRVLLDLHGVKDSQNGFDNSGRMAAIEWTQVPVMPPAGGVASSGAVQSTFSHWALQSPGWIGEFDRKKWKTVTLNWGNVDWAIGTLCLIAGACAARHQHARRRERCPRLLALLTRAHRSTPCFARARVRFVSDCRLRCAPDWCAPRAQRCTRTTPPSLGCSLSMSHGNTRQSDHSSGTTLKGAHARRRAAGGSGGWRAARTAAALLTCRARCTRVRVSAGTRR